MHADDTLVCRSFLPDSAVKVTQHINSDLETLIHTSREHNLITNPTKSFVMFFGSKHKRDLVAETSQHFCGRYCMKRCEQIGECVSS